MDMTIRRSRPQKIHAHIEVVGSSISRINAMSGDSRRSIAAVLREKYTNVGITVVNNIADLEALVAKKPDLVVLGMKLVLLDPEMEYDDSRKVWLSDYLEQHGIEFTGSGTDALTLEFNKQDAKQQVIDSGLESSSYFISTQVRPRFRHTLTFPLFVKPSNRGDSKGIDEHSVVNTQSELEAKIRTIHSEFESDALIEEYLPGREFSVAVVRQPGTDKLSAMPVEIVPDADVNGNRFLSAATKKADTEQVLAVDDLELKKALTMLAKGVFIALGSRDYGRIDLRLDGTGKPSFIEANLMPGLSNHGYLTRCFSINENISYEDMILAIVSLALERAVNTDEFDPTLDVAHSVVA